jgi:hypothetical protein
MKNIINNKKFEELLTTKWANFLDYRKVIAFVMAVVRDTDLPTHVEENLPPKGVEITISRFSIQSNGFLLWIDFTIPKEGGFAMGTCEAHLTNLGTLTSERIVGQFLKSR